MKYCVHGPAVAVKFYEEIVSANKMKRITYLTSEMPERRQESHTSDLAVKMTPPKKVSAMNRKGIT